MQREKEILFKGCFAFLPDMSLSGGTTRNFLRFVEEKNETSIQIYFNRISIEK